MKDLIIEFMELNSNILDYRDIAKVFGISLDELVNILDNGYTYELFDDGDFSLYNEFNKRVLFVSKLGYVEKSFYSDSGEILKTDRFNNEVILDKMRENSFLSMFR